MKKLIYITFILGTSVLSKAQDCEVAYNKILEISTNTNAEKYKFQYTVVERNLQTNTQNDSMQITVWKTNDVVIMENELVIMATDTNTKVSVMKSPHQILIQNNTVASSTQELISYDSLSVIANRIICMPYKGHKILKVAYKKEYFEGSGLMEMEYNDTQLLSTTTRLIRNGEVTEIINTNFQFFSGEERSGVGSSVLDLIYNNGVLKIAYSNFEVNDLRN
jgi:hypothetical protein